MLWKDSTELKPRMETRVEAARGFCATWYSHIRAISTRETRVDTTHGFSAVQSTRDSSRDRERSHAAAREPRANVRG